MERDLYRIEYETYDGSFLEFVVATDTITALKDFTRRHAKEFTEENQLSQLAIELHASVFIVKEKARAACS